MTKKQKIESLSNAMQSRITKDGNGTEWYFSNAPKELVDLFLEHYEVRDINYETFSRALDIVSEIYTEDTEISDEKATDRIYEQSSDSASYYTGERLSYLNIHNEGDITDILRDYEGDSIATACGIWYDKQVENQAIIIKDWINA